MSKKFLFTLDDATRLALEWLATQFPACKSRTALLRMIIAEVVAHRGGRMYHYKAEDRADDGVGRDPGRPPVEGYFFPPKETP